MTERRIVGARGRRRGRSCLVYLHTCGNRHMTHPDPLIVGRMSHFDIRVSRPADVPAIPTATAADDDAPARRLLAHDLEPLAWDDDGDGVLPPPD